MYSGTDMWAGQVATQRPQETQRSASILACSMRVAGDDLDEGVAAGLGAQLPHLDAFGAR